DEIINHIHTDIQHLTTSISNGQNSSDPLHPLISLPSQSSPSLLSTESSSSSPFISEGDEGEERNSPSLLIGTNTLHSTVQSTSMSVNEGETNEKNVVLPSNKKGKRRFNWDLFVMGCVEEQNRMNRGEESTG
ncbi:hypothetical protein PMAYCL1PPCAC_17935, partial [Pristionchus mayeri]